MRTHKIGLLCQPWGDATPIPGVIWAADNGCFNGAKWREDIWWKWITKQHPLPGCLFAAVPDVVGDAEATYERYLQYAPSLRSIGYRCAYVLQDGVDLDLIPWDAEVVFVGGSTEFKMSELAIDLAVDAADRGKWVHVGRVNSWPRFEAWAPFAHSCDGTFLRYGPTKNWPRLEKWIDRHQSNPQFADIVDHMEIRNLRVNRKEGE